MSATSDMSEQAILADTAIRSRISSDCQDGWGLVSPDWNAFNQITDQVMIAKVAAECWHGGMCMAAFERLSEQTLTNPIIIEGIAIEALHLQVRWAAAHKLVNQRLLATLIVEDKLKYDHRTGGSRESLNYYYECERLLDNAYQSLTDHDALSIIANRSKSERFRLDAAKKISDQVVLEEIALKSAEALNRSEAAKHIIDQAALARIAMLDVDLNWIVEPLINDPLLLAKVALYTSKKRGAKLSTVERIVDQAALLEIATCDKDERTRITAAMKLTDHSRGQEIISQIAMNSREANNRSLALSYIDDQGIIAEMAVKETEYWLAVNAVKKITDQRLLSVISTAEGVNNSNARSAATDKLTEEALPYLADILITGKPDSFVRWSAAGKVGHFLEKAQASNRCSNDESRKYQVILADYSINEPDKSRGPFNAVRYITDHDLLIKVLSEGGESAQLAAREKLSHSK